ncbi:ATP-dependent RNA helicase HrpA [Inhella gelatinilytica]|uniref:ATP-dependent RNA helicase HrpA n=1 Tax=Inhella gelatinilytica TaxID=2795030 RepID=A0A931NDU3_9BURK|nr:ATP-dependent RNA helicase HrpA [Inhella gelatinilytica]MBH9553457.1 ATP-dependent RNA helicase HrpA [Inhella gelatinilytica]
MNDDKPHSRRAPPAVSVERRPKLEAQSALPRATEPRSGAERRPAAPATPIPPISFPESLPVSGRREEIAAALRSHQVVIVCGETGSGKTTQLPKIALALGRGTGNGGRLIGHTQPRRLAATSVAKRIAEELNSPLGEVVGYKIRFNDRLQPGASVKLMTDGILLAETQTDPLLKRYDTLIIDEAHERSLNIDFLLGYLKNILPRRPDLKIVVTSATIDAERFARHFESKRGPAPVIQVSGRLYPVEQRWRPFEEKKDYGLADAIRDAVDELWRSGPGDCLVFLPGEREIREVAETLRGHHPPGVDVLPLFARLSQQDQDKIFQPHGAPRIVLATNVAETSLTVPGIRFVIDAGTARVKRYSYRNKVEQLQIEPISQAAANQRAGRCGRVSNGICVRLYGEQEFAQRARFTDPEILRSSLAGVILRMKSLGLGAVEDFPFLEAPPGKAIADGYQLLAELGAVDEKNELTDIGLQLAKLPLDPRVGRMLLAARDSQALTEMLIIASSLSSQDVRDRPPESASQADAKHKPFDDEKSEFTGLLKLWKWLETSRGGEGQHKLSHRKHEALLREHFINPRRVREWRDIHQQLHSVVAEQGWRLNESEATYEQLHRALLAGLLGNIGLKSETEDTNAYVGARGIKFWPWPGAHLSKKPGRWVLASELVETSRLWGRGLANIDPAWVLAQCGHLLKTSLSEPHWEKKAGEVVALERGTLYGLTLYQGKRVNFGRLDAAKAREIFIRDGLVAGEMESDLPFLAHNAKRVAEVERLEHKARRQDVLVDDELIYLFYDAHIPDFVCSTATLERWYRSAVKEAPKLLHFSREDLMRHEAAGITSDAFPKMLRLGGVDCRCEYLHDPGDARDGLTVTIPVFALNPVSDAACEWLVPGLVEAKVTALIKALPQKPRARLAPVPAFVTEFVAATPFGEGSLIDGLLAAIKQRVQLPLTRADFKLELLSPHLFMNLRIVDEHGRQLGMGRHLAALKAEFSGLARSSFQALAALKLASNAAQAAQPSAPLTDARSQGAPSKASSGHAPAAPAPVEGTPRYTDWSFGELPELLEIRRGSQSLIGFPALIDKGSHVEIEVFDEPESAQALHRHGLLRLFALQLKEPLKGLEKNLGADFLKLGVAFMSLGTVEELRAQVLNLALDRAFAADPLPTTAAEFQTRMNEGRPRLVLIAQEVVRLAGTVLVEFQATLRKLKDARAPKEVAEDIQSQLDRLLPKQFLVRTPWAQLQHFARYLKAIQVRLDKCRADLERDARLLSELRPLEQRWQRRVAERRGTPDPRLDEFRWQLEELRVSLFAQELRTPQPVSVKRLEKVWQQMQG